MGLGKERLGALVAAERAAHGEVVVMDSVDEAAAQRDLESSVSAQLSTMRKGEAAHARMHSHLPSSLALTCVWCHHQPCPGFSAINDGPGGGGALPLGQRGFLARLVATGHVHNDLIARILHVPSPDRYVTAGRDGVVCVWEETQPNTVCVFVQCYYTHTTLCLTLTSLLRGCYSSHTVRASEPAKSGLLTWPTSKQPAD